MLYIYLARHKTVKAAITAVHLRALHMNAIAALFKRLRRRTADSIAPTKQFNLLRWFSVVSLLLISMIALGLGSVSTRFLVAESLERDSLLSEQFIQTIARNEIHDHGLTGIQIGEAIPSYEYETMSNGVQSGQLVRSKFLDYLSRYPDSLLISIYSPRRTVIWSTNPDLIGKKILNEEL